MIPLHGTLEVVLLNEVYREKTATGYGTVKRNEQPIYVANGAPFFGQCILVRTDTWLNKGDDPFKDIPTLTAQVGNFVTSEIPPEMKDGLWLPFEKYILTGILPWRGNWPVLDEVNRAYDPGKMGNAPYFPIADQDGMLIHVKEPDIYVKDYQEAIKYRLKGDTERHARVILVGTDGQASELESMIRDKDIIPVRMQPLHPKKAAPTVAAAVSLH